MTAAIDVPTRRGKLAEWLRFLVAEGHYLRGHPEALFQQAANQPETTAPARGTRDPGAGGPRRRPWLRWLNRPERPSACRLTLVGHDRGVTSARFIGDGARVASQALDGTLRLWDAWSGVELAALPCRESSTAWAVSPDCRIAVVETWEGDLSVRDLDSGAELATLGECSWIEASWLAPDGGSLIVSTRSGIWSWPLGGAGDPRRLADGRALDLDARGRLVRLLESRLDVVDAGGGAPIVKLGGRSARDVLGGRPDRRVVGHRCSADGAAGARAGLASALEPERAVAGGRFTRWLGADFGAGGDRHSAWGRVVS